MKIANITYGQHFYGNKQNQKNGFLDNLHSHVKNSADMTDTILVSRTIFKGYLGIMTGTTLVTLGGLVNKENFKLNPPSIPPLQGGLSVGSATLY